MKTSKENLEKITKILSVNTDYVGSDGMLHVQVQISFLNMIGLVFKFMLALAIASPLAIGFIFLLKALVVGIMSGNLPGLGGM